MSERQVYAQERRRPAAPAPSFAGTPSNLNTPPTASRSQPTKSGECGVSSDLTAARALKRNSMSDFNHPRTSSDEYRERILPDGWFVTDIEAAMRAVTDGVGPFSYPHVAPTRCDSPRHLQASTSKLLARVAHMSDRAHQQHDDIPDLSRRSSGWDRRAFTHLCTKSSFDDDLTGQRRARR